MNHTVGNIMDQFLDIFTESFTETISMHNTFLENLQNLNYRISTNLDRIDFYDSLQRYNQLDQAVLPLLTSSPLQEFTSQESQTLYTNLMDGSNLDRVEIEILGLFNDTLNTLSTNDNLDTLTNTLTNTITNTFTQIFANPTFEDVAVTLTPDDFEKLDHGKYNIEDGICNICMDKLEHDIISTKLACQHCFHQQCVKEWLCNYNVHCPVCRQDVRESLNKN